jgi:signal transduction histidine kinase
VTRRRVLSAGAGALVTAAAITTSLVELGFTHTLVVLGVVVGIVIATAVGVERIASWRGPGPPGPLSRQFAVVIALVIGPLLVTMLILGLMMFVSGKDAALVAVIVALTGVAGVAAAGRVAGMLAGDVATVRDGLLAVGRGERDIELVATRADELHELAQAANAMIGRLVAEEAARDQSDASRRHLVAAASHDLRTPITSLRLLAQAIDDELVVGEQRREYVQRMLVHIEALSALIDDLFELSRLEAGDITWSLERVALGALVSETVDAMRVHADAKHVVVRADLPVQLALARANPEKLQRVLFNLIQNAIRHSPADGSVVVRAEALDDVLEVEVENGGDAIPPEEREHVFDAFYRGSADAARTSGNAGLGLAVARAIVEAHGGEIWLPITTSGTRVRFSVPIAG